MDQLKCLEISAIASRNEKTEQNERAFYTSRPHATSRRPTRSADARVEREGFASLRQNLKASRPGLQIMNIIAQDSPRGSKLTLYQEMMRNMKTTDRNKPTAWSSKSAHNFSIPVALRLSSQHLDVCSETAVSPPRQSRHGPEHPVPLASTSQLCLKT